ncbi:hypothetical protein Pint_27411 [Pistacia integerrima]|uniref:Uncharacterized protein n=1 Tax=Pistacia integerrima TaxID=434235 RepID=A0ACC0YVE9_9ROSI|nr:hypothetical protein Pint_27411 [Pistacia integerrima]
MALLGIGLIFVLTKFFFEIFFLQKSLLYNVPHVERHVFCELLIQQITEEGSSTHVLRKSAISLRIWEDDLNSGTRGRSNPHAHISGSASNTSRRGGCGRGRGSQSVGRALDMTFVSATGAPISDRRCYVCGDPSHFANVCPNRGT